MTYGDIIEWIEENYDFEPNENARDAFNQISDEWASDNRDTLANTLGQEAESFITRIQNINLNTLLTVWAYYLMSLFIIHNNTLNID